MRRLCYGRYWIDTVTDDQFVEFSIPLALWGDGCTRITLSATGILEVQRTAPTASPGSFATETLQLLTFDTPLSI
jgi:hypothetical protein